MKNNEENEKERFFKSKIMNPNEFIKCDICCRRIKTDEMSLYSVFYNMVGHYDHIISFINAVHLQRIYNK